MKTSCIPLAAALLAAFVLPVSAKTYYVKADGGGDIDPKVDKKAGLSEGDAFATIQFAIDHAAAGSTILVYPGTYAPIVSNNKKLAIKAVEGADATIIDGRGEPRAIGADMGAWTTGQYASRVKTLRYEHPTEEWAVTDSYYDDYGNYCEISERVWETVEISFINLLPATTSYKVPKGWWGFVADDDAGDNPCLGRIYKTRPPDWFLHGAGYAGVYDPETENWVIDFGEAGGSSPRDPWGFNKDYGAYEAIEYEGEIWVMSWDQPDWSDDSVKAGSFSYKIGKATTLSGFTLTGCEIAARDGNLSYAIVSNNVAERVGQEAIAEYRLNYARDSWAAMGLDEPLVMASSMLFGVNVSDCVITGNRCFRGLDWCDFQRCEIVDNDFVSLDESLDEPGTTGLLANVGYGMPFDSMKNTLFAGNRTELQLIWGDIHNSTIASNQCDFGESAGENAGILVDCSLYNSIIWGNVDPDGNIVNFYSRIDEKTNQKIYDDFMNGWISWTVYDKVWVEDEGFLDGGYWEPIEVGVDWKLLFAWDTMMNCLADTEFPIVQTGNKGSACNSKNNMIGDPCFIDPAHGDYHLAPWSPCVDAGADYTKKTGKFDLDSAARKVGKVDLGAYETQPRMAVPADYDGDGVTDAAFFFSASKQWWVFGSRDGVRTFSLPDANGTPCPGDYDGDGCAEPAYYLAAAKVPEFVRIGADGIPVRTAFGEKGATPVAAKLSADPKAPATFGVYTANAKKPAFSFLGNPLTVAFGAKASRPVVADFDNDGKDDLGVYTATASKPTFSILQSTEGYGMGALFTGKPVVLGPKGAIPCCADFDGDKKADFGVYMSNTKEPYFQRLFSSSKFRETRTLPMGSKGDMPAVGVYEAGQPAAPAIWTGSVWTYVGSDWENNSLVGE